MAAFALRTAKILPRAVHPRSNLRALREFARTLKGQGELLVEMTKNELQERHAGQIFGKAWPFLHPLLMVVVYVFLFTVVFRVRLDQQGLGVPGDFTLYILAGLVPWLAMQDVLSKSTQAITGNGNLVKQMIFPIEILPAKIVCATAVTEAMLLAVLVGYTAVSTFALPWTVLLLPYLLACQVTMMLGLALLLSSVGSFFRDLKELVQVFCMVNVYLMPVVYLPGWVPAEVRPLIELNPFTCQAYCYQDALFFGRIEHPLAWAVFPVLAVGMLAFGARTFGKFRHSFGNVL